ncbi:exodeoxyribonuclease VII large subunit [Poseidonocella sedimentorum]|uniref:Exodeoxyribonuclease 7 large subunit n=1 Tax=Poseidonocella sedimentorum TaxID=871652 RepID=A0A1I6EGY7_9RHOB|nr:exodeoxyribonuclease VII large subunit [Poseidonocella sedimentorum]SFR17016.1 Exodeoxyribonuclease VII large subunit [Poseidonocella sedimentorum]
MDLIDEPSPGANEPEFTVSEISGAIKRVIEGEFGHVRIRGELGRVSRPRSGHVYLDLKDDRAVMSGVIWKGVAARLQVQPEEGMEVVATGRVTTFPGQSKYQLVIDDLKPAGLGALMAMLEKRRKALAAEGLFDDARKQPLPFLPEVIGVVTSPSGAVIRDILHRLRDRFPRKVLLWPVAVQGERCAAEVARAIAGFNAMTPGGALPRPDLLIVARGGGSIEDLWGFNEEAVVRAAAASEIPLISAVGHETDTTLIDFAADRRAPTPTAAAEMAVPVRADLLSWLEGQGGRMRQASSQALAQRGQRLQDLSRALPRPETLLDGPRQRLDVLSDRLPQALLRGVQRHRVQLSDLSGALRPAGLRRQLDGEARRLEERGSRLAPAFTRGQDIRRDLLARRADRLSLRTLAREMDRTAQELDRVSQSFVEAARRQTRLWRDRLTGLARLNETLSYRGTLERGYAVVRSEAGVVTSRAEAGRAKGLEIEFKDGRLALDGKRRSGKAKPEDTPEQGSLL